MSKRKIEHIEIKEVVKQDTLRIPSPVKDTLASPSLFQSHLLTIKNPKPQLHITKYDYWLSGILLFLYVLFIWLFVTNRKKLGQIIKGFYQTHYTNMNTRDEFSIGNRVSVFLSIFFVITLTIFISKTLLFYNIKLIQDTSVEIIIALSLIVAYSIKFIVINFLGFVFQIQKEARDYMMSVFLFCNALGLFMLPLVICLSFMKQLSPVIFIYTGAGVIGTFLFIRLVRGIFIGFLSPRVSKFYLFMYLCTLEILPFFLIVKLVILKMS